MNDGAIYWPSDGIERDCEEDGSKLKILWASGSRSPCLVSDELFDMNHCTAVWFNL